MFDLEQLLLNTTIVPCVPEMGTLKRSRLSSMTSGSVSLSACGAGPLVLVPLDVTLSGSRGILPTVRGELSQVLLLWYGGIIAVKSKHKLLKKKKVFLS